MFKNLLKIFSKPEKKLEKQKKVEERKPSREKQRGEEIINKAKREAFKIREVADKEASKTHREILEVEKRIIEKEKEIDNKSSQIKREKGQLLEARKKLEERKSEILRKLEKVAQLSKEEARNLLLKTWEERLKKEIADKIRQSEEEIKATKDKKAKEILVDVMRYGATDYVAEYTLSTISLPDEKYKGRIIGKDGRNIRAFELATGVDLDLEEEGVIKISSFDSIKREVARVALKQLIKDGRIQPQRIEEIVNKTKKEIEKITYKAGEDLAHKTGVFNLPTEIIRLLGKFKYRYSYGQSMILHTLEETKIGVALAQELKADVQVVRLGCLLHDIGKVINDKEGSHVDLAVELLKKHNFPKKIIDTVASHHEDIPFASIEAVIVYISDAVSGGRPGARHEDFQHYLKRIKTIEETAKANKGVKDAYALQAGRELRVIIEPSLKTDDESVILANKIKKKLEEKFDVFPGQIKITVIREFRIKTTTKI